MSPLQIEIPQRGLLHLIGCLAFALKLGVHRVGNQNKVIALVQADFALAHFVSRFHTDEIADAISRGEQVTKGVVHPKPVSVLNICEAVDRKTLGRNFLSSIHFQN